MSFGGGDTPIGDPQTGLVSAEARLFDWLARHYRLLAIAILALAAFNLTYRRAWLGPLLAGVFLLKGMAVLMPLAMVIITAVWARKTRVMWPPVVAAVLLFLAPTGAWVAARWQVDQWRFFDRMFNQDFIALASSAVEERTGGVLFYLDVLPRYQYDWLLAGLGAVLLARRSWDQLGRVLRLSFGQRQPTVVLMSAWAVGTLLVPTLVQTKLFWYLNPFYPLFALAVGLALANVVFNNHHRDHTRRVLLAGILIVVAVGSAQARSLWRIHVVTNLDTSVQGMLLSKRADFRGTRVCRDCLHRGEAFVVKAMMHTTFHVITGANRGGAPRAGDLYVFSREVRDARLRPAGRADGHFLYEAP